jgi:nucleotidyltransferase/DNA polymerase involved in DNA repair
MRFACLLVEHLPTRVESLLDPSLSGKPIAIVRGWDDRVIDATPDVIACGISLNDSRRRIEQLCPQVILLPGREAVYEAHHDQLRSVLLNFANAVETVGLGEFLIEVSDLARSFPSEAALALQIIQQVDQVSALQPVLGLASNKFTASRAARAAASQLARSISVPANGERAFLDPLPVRALPEPPPEMLRRLNLFAIQTLGSFGQLPHAAVVLQFGPEAGFYHDLARGLDPRPLLPQSPPPAVVRTLHLPEPLSDRAMVMAAVERLAARISHRLEENGYQALALSLVVTTRDQHEYTAGATVKPPSSNAEQLRRLGGRLLGRLTFETEVSVITLRAYPLREWQHGAQQLSLFDTAESSKWSQFRVALQALQKRFGEAVLRLASTLGPPVPLPIRVQAQADGTPIELAWSRWSRRVTNLYEYWREQRAWWDQLVVRDYYQIEIGDGSVFTLFRDADGRWFLDRRRS